MKTNLSMKTLITYESTINAIFKALKLTGNRPDSGEWIQEHWQQIVAHVEASVSIHSKKNRYAILKVYATLYSLDDSIIEYLDAKMKALNDEVAEGYETNEMSAKVATNWVGLKELKQTRDTLKQKLAGVIDTYNEYKLLCKYLILLIHLEIPLRNDLANAKISYSKTTPTDETINHIVLKTKRTGVIILNDYKTKKQYGATTIQIPQHIVIELHKHLPTIQRMSPHGWLIFDKDDSTKPISRTTLTKWLNDVFKDTGKSVSTTQIRRAVVSHLHDVGPNTTMKQKKQLAAMMGHSLTEASTVYAKQLTDEQK